MKIPGYMGKILRVELTSGDFTQEDLDSDAVRDYVGGLGMNARLMQQTYETGTDPLSPGNPIILGTGPLAATGVPGAAKVIATTRFPLNGAISESVGSMRFALNLKGAGFDHVIITGRAPRPVAMIVHERGASLVDAREVQGCDIFDTTDAMTKKHAGPKGSVIAIGSAGENMVAFSLALVDKASTIGRGGLGAIMGSKNLKAIVAVGDARPSVHDPDTLKRLLAEMRERLKRFKNHRRVLQLGIMENWDNYVQQLFAYRNFGEAFSHEKATELYGPDVYRSLKVKRLGCPGCFTPDKDRLEVAEGPHKGFNTITTSYLNSALFGHVFDLNRPSDKTASLRTVDTLDRLGLDMFTFGRLLDFLITMSERGACDPARFPVSLKRDFESVNLWADAIASRKGAADILARGWRSLLENLGGDSGDHAPIVKDCDVIWDPRLVGLGTMEFEQIVSLKGPRSASGGSPTYVPGQTQDNLPLFRRHFNRMGADDKAIDRIMDSPLGFNVGRMTRYAEDWYTILSSLGLCNRHFVNRFYSYERCRKLFSAVTGFQVEEDHLRASAERIWNLLKTLNQREGFGPDADRPPKIWFNPMKGPNGEALVLRDYFGTTRLEENDLLQLVHDYYHERGWTRQGTTAG